MWLLEAWRGEARELLLLVVRIEKKDIRGVVVGFM
jgi:hypothetical protein